MRKLCWAVGFAMMLASCASPGTSAGGNSTVSETSVTLVPSVAGLHEARLVTLTAAIKYSNAGYDLEPPGQAKANVSAAISLDQLAHILATSGDTTDSSLSSAAAISSLQPIMWAT